MRAAAEGFIARASQNAYELDVSKVDEETRERLAALGYIGSFSDPARLKGQKLADPKDKIGIFNDLSMPRDGLEGKADDAIRMIQGSSPKTRTWATPTSPRQPLLRKRKYMDAIAAFERALELKPDDSFAVMNVAGAYQAMGRFTDAERFVLEYLKTGFRDSSSSISWEHELPSEKLRQGIGYFEQCLTENPRSASSITGWPPSISCETTWPGRGAPEGGVGPQPSPAKSPLQYGPASRKAEPFRRGRRLLPPGDPGLSEELQSALQPLRVYRRWAGRRTNCGPATHHGSRAEIPLTYFYLARFHLNRGERYQEAVDLVSRASSSSPRSPNSRWVFPAGRPLQPPRDGARSKSTRPRAGRPRPRQRRRKTRARISARPRPCSVVGVVTVTVSV